MHMEMSHILNVYFIQFDTNIHRHTHTHELTCMLHINCVLCRTMPWKHKCKEQVGGLFYTAWVIHMMTMNYIIFLFPDQVTENNARKSSNPWWFEPKKSNNRVIFPQCSSARRIVLPLLSLSFRYHCFCLHSNWQYLLYELLDKKMSW